MFTKQVCLPLDSLDGRSWLRRGANRANSEKDLVTAPIRGFCALQALQHDLGACEAQMMGNADLATTACMRSPIQNFNPEGEERTIGRA